MDRNYYCYDYTRHGSVLQSSVCSVKVEMSVDFFMKLEREKDVSSRDTLNVTSRVPLTRGEFKEPGMRSMRIGDFAEEIERYSWSCWSG